MKFRIAFTAAIVLVSFITRVYGQFREMTIPKEVSDAITASNRVYSRAFEQHQAGLMVGCYATDGAILSPNISAISMRDGILKFFNGGYEHGIRKIIFRTTMFFSYNGTYVNEEGLYELKNDHEKTLDAGKYIVVWKKTGSGWKMYRDIFNSSLAADK